MNSFEKKLGKECTALNILLRQKNIGKHDYFCMHFVVIFKSFYVTHFSKTSEILLEFY